MFVSRKIHSLKLNSRCDSFKCWGLWEVSGMNACKKRRKELPYPFCQVTLLGEQKWAITRQESDDAFILGFPVFRTVRGK